MGRVFMKGAALMAPLPAALITCRGADGRKNVLTASWTGIANTRPPMAYVSIRQERFSYNIIKETGVFAINLTTSKQARQTDLCGMKSGSRLDKFAKCGFEISECETINCPLISDCPITLECSVNNSLPLGSHTMFIADITGVSVDERYIDSKGKINLGQAGLMAYSHGEYYALGRKLGDFGFSVKKRRGAGR